MINDQTIICPDCGKKIALSQALTEQVTHDLQHRLERGFAQKFETQIEKSQLGLKTKLETEKQKLWAVAQSKAREKIGTELKDLQAQFDEKAQRLVEAEKNEFELRKKTRQLDEEKRAFELTMQRKLDEERQKLVTEARKVEADQQRLKMLEKDKQIEIMQRTIEELRQQSQQGSMQIQGEVQENELKQLLISAFPSDVITDVPTGIKGADLIQIVNNPVGQKAGAILWESKNTKTWNNDWVTKLKQDQGAAEADVCMLVSRVVPDDITGFGVRNGVWILEYQYVIPLVTTLRIHLLEIAKVKATLVGRDQKMEYLYEYISGTQFKNRIESIILAFGSMKSELEHERRAMERIWHKRGQEIERIIHNTAGLYGDLQGIVGQGLSNIQSLELDAEVEITSPALNSGNAGSEQS